MKTIVAQPLLCLVFLFYVTLSILASWYCGVYVKRMHTQTTSTRASPRKT